LSGKVLITHKHYTKSAYPSPEGIKFT